MLRHLLVALLAFQCACATTATVSRINGGPLEAEIEDSDRDSVVVRTAGGPQVSVPRSEITDIDHPGNVVAVVGGALSAYGILNIATGASGCETYGGAYCVGVFLPAAVGIPMIVWGLSVWSKSRDAANRFGPPRVGAIPAAPAPAAFDFSGQSGGGSARELRERYRQSQSVAQSTPAPAAPALAAAPENAPAMSSAEALRERYRRARAEGASAAPAGTDAPPAIAMPSASAESKAEGFQSTHWGMRPADVQALYPEAVAGGADGLTARRTVAGQPATLRFDFRAGQLTVVRVYLDAKDAEEAAALFARFRELLGRKYGAPTSQSASAVAWATGGTTIRLNAASKLQEPLSLTYESSQLGDSTLNEL